MNFVERQDLIFTGRVREVRSTVATMTSILDDVIDKLDAPIPDLLSVCTTMRKGLLVILRYLGALRAQAI